MSRKQSKLKKTIKKRFKDALLKYIVVKFRDFPFCVYPTVSN